LAILIIRLRAHRYEIIISHYATQNKPTHRQRRWKE